MGYADSGKRVKDDVAAGGNSTLHQKILSDIRQRIVSGEWQPGYRLPFEVDLAATYGCSRMTVNKVMTQLVNAGLIVRQRKAGSFVARPRVESAVLQISDIESEVTSSGSAYAYSVTSQATRQASAEDRRVMNVDAGTPIIEVLATHMADGHPFCLEERLINADTVPAARSAAFSTMPPGKWLVRNMPWTSAEHRVYAREASPELARQLQIGKGGACLVIERRTWSESGPVTWVRFTYPAESHSVVAHFTPASP
jgi:GntR family histidine utilization transcriptional repressor